MCFICGSVFYRFAGRGVRARKTQGCTFTEATYRGTMHSLHITSKSIRSAPPRWQALKCAPPVGVQMSADDLAAYLLSTSELRLLTGRVKHRTQVDWLATNDIPFLLDASGRPRVLRKFIEARLSGSDARGEHPSLPNGEQQSVAIRPKFAALDVHALTRRRRNNGS